AARGAIVVAATDEASKAARALAFDVYRDAVLRPGIDDATARALVGEPLAEQPPQKLKDIVELRASIAAHAGDATGRRLLASLASDSGAELVVLVSLEGGRPVAKVLRSATATFERVELGATIETPESGAPVVRWPGATALLEGFLAKPPLVPAA